MKKETWLYWKHASEKTPNALHGGQKHMNLLIIQLQLIYYLVIQKGEADWKPKFHREIFWTNGRRK